MGKAFIPEFDKAETDFNSEDYDVSKEKIISWADLVSNNGRYFKSHNYLAKKVWGRIERNFISGYFPVYKTSNDERPEANVLPEQKRRAPVFCHASDILEASFHVNNSEITTIQKNIENITQNKNKHKESLEDIEEDEALPEGFLKIYARIKASNRNSTKEISRIHLRDEIENCDIKTSGKERKIKTIQNSFKEQVEWLQSLNDYSNLIDTNIEEMKLKRINGQVKKEYVKDGNIKSVNALNI